MGVIIFMQSECGDLYKVTLEIVGEDVLKINVSYFDTIAPCTKINLLESGFLFAAGDCANHFSYRLTNLGDDESPLKFVPRSTNENLEICDQLQNLACINDVFVGNQLGTHNKD